MCVHKARKYPTKLGAQRGEPASQSLTIGLGRSGDGESTNRQTEHNSSNDMHGHWRPSSYPFCFYSRIVMTFVFNTREKSGHEEAVNQCLKPFVLVSRIP